MAENPKRGGCTMMSPLRRKKMPSAKELTLRFKVYNLSYLINEHFISQQRTYHLS